MNDVRTKKMRIFNFVSGLAGQSAPSCLWPTQATGRATMGQWVQHPNPPHVFLCGLWASLTHPKLPSLHMPMFLVHLLGFLELTLCLYIRYFL